MPPTGLPPSLLKPLANALSGAALALVLAVLPDLRAEPVDYRVVGDGIPAPLTATPGQAAAGRVIFSEREAGHCLLCHAVDRLDEPFQGNVGPNLSTVGARLTAAQLRLRIVDATRLNPRAVMPSYYRVSGLNQVGEPYRGRPVLTAQQVEDLIAFLQTLQPQEVAP